MAVIPATVTSFGSFTGTSFSVNVLGTAAGFGDQSPASTGATPTVLAAQTGLDIPTTLSLLSGAIDANYTPVLGTGSNPTKSVLWGYTSNNAPLFGITAFIGNNATSADGTVPFASTVPEPSSVVLSAIGLSAFGLFASRRRRAVRG